MLFYTAASTPRLEYITSVLFDAIGLHAVTITTNIEDFKAYDGSKINYSSTSLTAGEIWLHPSALLFESGVKEQSIHSFAWNRTTAFFQVPAGDFPFDIFAASFFLLSRYEEYLPHEKDEYGRYSHKQSIAFKEGFLHLPLINVWLQKFSAVLMQKFPQLSFTLPQFQFVPTYDIDIAWSYFAKGVVRNIGGLFRSLLDGHLWAVEDRMSVLMGNRDDPFDVYAWLDELHEEHNLKPLYFFLLADKVGRYDKNVHPKNKFYQLLIRKLSVMYNTGIHPSWQSGDIPALVQKETDTLGKITGKAVVNSRQHYIRMSMPDTYRRLIAAGIKNDYSMGYGSINGFRASYCLPYKWYDLLKEEATDLTIYPYCYMEANSLFEQRYSAQQAFEEMRHYYETTRAVNGTLITIFHNHLLTTHPHLIEWRTMYEQFLKSLGH